VGTIERATGMSRLTRSECWQLLSGPAVGRLGIVVDGAPEVYPVNYVVDGESVVYRVDGHNRLDEASPSVCFQIDAFDTDRHRGWSVLVKGSAQRLAHPDARLRSESPAGAPDLAGEHWVRITPVEVSGRKIWRGTADMEPERPQPDPTPAEP
jgi:uncharacterized protein